MAAGIRKRSVIVAGHRTSISVEDEFWIAISQIAAARGLSVNQLVTSIDRARGGNLSSALRLFVLDHLRAELAATSAADGAEKRPR